MTNSLDTLHAFFRAINHFLDPDEVVGCANNERPGLWDGDDGVMVGILVRPDVACVRHRCFRATYRDRRLTVWIVGECYHYPDGRSEPVEHQTEPTVIENVDGAPKENK